MSYQLTIEPLGEAVPLDEKQTLLEACLRNGIWLPHACGHGLCGSCKVQVLVGEFDQGEASSFALMDFEREENYCLACCATALSDLTIAANVDEDPDAEHHPLRDYVATVTDITSLTPTIKRIALTLPAPGIAFQAGQHINVRIPNTAARRPFSIASSPASPQHIELHVKRVEHGEGTGYLHDNLRVGETLQFSGPYGRFYIRKSVLQPVLLLAAGSGLSCIYAMLLDLLGTRDEREITLVYGARHECDLYYHDKLMALAQRYSRLNYLPVLSQPVATWPGAQGYVQQVAAAHFQGDFRGLKSYICGPQAMIEECIRTLMQGRLFEKDIYVERFLAGENGGQSRSPLFKSL